MIARALRVGTLALALAAVPAGAQPQGAMPSSAPVSQSFFVDILPFHGNDSSGRMRADVYIVVPYTSLEFRSTALKAYGASYKVTLTVRDSLSRRIIDTTFTRQVRANSYEVSRGSTGAIDHVIRSYSARPGTHRVEVSVTDQFSRRAYTQTKTVVIDDYRTNRPNLSGIVLATDIEEHEGRFKLTPFVGEALTGVTDRPLFAFVEAYPERTTDRVGFRWAIASDDGKVLASGRGPIQDLRDTATQVYMRLAVPQRPAPGRYTLAITMHPATALTMDTTELLARSARTVIIPKTLSADVMSDLNKGIKYLRYVGTQADIDRLLEIKDDNEREVQFELFWKERDPTPSTVKNEAFEEYYARVDHANKNFRSYNEGWLTDMGMVYIIYGPPTNIERYGQSANRPSQIVWTYGSSRRYVFEDRSGFGDYHLVTPLPGEKYEYNNQ
jgi:GWxTD domain-containing protein